MKRDVVVLLSRAPGGRVHVPEGLRAARGVAAGFDRHDVTVVFTEDATHAARAAADRVALNMTDHVADLRAEGGRMVADAAALDERGIDHGAVADDVEVLPGDAVGELIRAADHNLTF
jgi:tRNA 2-thiouridine synthesizing protein C